MSRIADGVDLAIDAMTLGQYGLETADPAEPGCRPTGRSADRRSARTRGDCDGQYTWDWPRSACRAS